CATAGGRGANHRAQRFFAAGFGPRDVRGTADADRLHFLPAGFPFGAAGGAEEAFLVQGVEVVLELVSGAGSVFTDDAGDRRAAGAFSRVEFVPARDTALEDGRQVGVGDRFHFATRGRVGDDRDRGLGDRDHGQVGTAGDAGDVGDLSRRRGVIGGD